MKRILLLTVALGWCLLHAVAEEYNNFFSKYNFSFITEEAGLPHNYIDDIYKDSKGYIWVATHNGIGRYNGYQFLHYDTRTSGIRLKSAFVHKICEDNHQRLWIGAEEGISIIDLNDYQETMPEAAQFPEIQEIFHANIETLYKDREGNLWISTDKSLWCLEFNTQGGICDYYHLRHGAQSSIHAIIDLGWCICAGIDNHVCQIKRSPKHQLKVGNFSKLLEPFTHDWRILCMETHGDDLWIGTNRGLFKYNHNKQTTQRYRYSSHRPGMLSQAYITDIKITSRGKVIISTLNGLNVYNEKEDNFFYIRQDNREPDKSLNSNYINCLYIDEEQIWIGTEIGGINLLTPQCLETQVWEYNYRKETSLSPNPVTGIREDRDGNLWVGTIEGGLNKKAKDADAFIHFTFDRTQASSISTNSINGLLIDSDNHLWAYTWGTGINELDLNIPDNRRFIRHIREDSLGLEGDFLSCASEDPLNNGIWFGTTRGLHFYHKADKRFTRVLFDQSDNEFDGNSSLLIDRQNRLWWGTSEGVFIMDLHSFALSHTRFDYTYLKYKLDEPSSMKLEKINCILEDKDGGIWLGSNGHGLYQAIEEAPNHFMFKNYTRADGLSNNYIIGIVEDNYNNLWMPTNYGISRLDRNTLFFTNFTKEDGLPNNHFFGNAYYYSERNNLLYFGTINGLVAINPQVELADIQKAKVIISSVSVSGNVTYPPMGANEPHIYTDANTIRLHEKDHGFILEFSTLNYGNSNRVKYEYRLKGYERHWTSTQGGEYSAKYNAVPAGDYVFQIRATDEKGHWGEDITEIEIRITPYFYKTVWFYLLLILVVGFATYYFYQRRTRLYRQQKRHLEQVVEQRTQELAKQNKQLETLAKHVEEVTEEKIAFFTNITHEFRTPVTLINGPLKRALKESTEPQVQEQLKLAEKNSNYLLSLVNELMDFRKLDAEKVVLQPQNQDLISFMQNLIMPFEVFARERNITLRTFYRLPSPYWIFDEEYLRKALVNLISNAIKFTPDHGRISIYVAYMKSRTGKEGIFVDVRDTGHGIAPEDTERIFERFYQSPKSVKYPVYGQSSTGIGLFLCKKIVALHGGEIQAGNNPTGGAYFRVLLPLERGEKIQKTPIPSTNSSMEALILPEKEEKKTILVAEDNPDMRAYIQSILQKEYKVVLVQNGAEALEYLTHRDADLIISDLMMPVMDGNELSKQVKANLATSHIPFLMLTAIRSEQQEKLSYEIGVDEYLHKPFDEDILRLRIHNILSTREKFKQRFSNNMTYDALSIAKTSKDSQFMDKAMTLIKEHYSDSGYNLERFVKDMGYSKTLVNEKLQSLTGQSIGVFMKNYRLNVAKASLERGNGASVSEIAYAVGFNDPKYFTRCFKELFGVLPSEIKAS
ncbi:MAG: response regulator [Bacteroides sp.]|nr:response regulator [Bacteroides sp.]